MAKTILHLEIESTAFKNGGRIPLAHTRDGENASPPLSWSGMPEGTKSMALICDDPDAPAAKPFAHWVLYNLPPTATGLPAAGDVRGAIPGINDFGEVGYDGPEPPRGHGVHRYHFALYALDKVVDPRDGMTKDDLMRAIDGHILGQGEIVGTYSR